MFSEEENEYRPSIKKKKKKKVKYIVRHCVRGKWRGVHAPSL